MLPFRQKRKDGLLIREFSKDVDSSELVWHRDRADRHVKIRKGTDWQLQLENKLPINLEPGRTYYIPKNTYHRVVKGKGSLIIEIREVEQKMKITKRQLRRIIREACGLQDHGQEEARLDHVKQPGPQPEVPSPQDYDAVRGFMDSNPDVVDLGISMVMELVGVSCERSTAQAIIDHLQGMLGAPDDDVMFPEQEPSADDQPDIMISPEILSIGGI